MQNKEPYLTDHGAENLVLFQGTTVGFLSKYNEFYGTIL